MRTRLVHTFLVLAVIIEILCLSGPGKVVSHSTISIIYFLSGIMIGISFLFPITGTKTEVKSNHLLTMGFFALLCLVSVEYLKEIFHAVPIDYRTADMLPMIQVMCQRFIQGFDIYAVVSEIWGGTQPIYLPALWLIFVPAELFNLDLRWISTFAVLAAFWLIIYKANLSISRSILLIIPTILLLLSLICFDTTTMSMTQEGVVVFYYVLLAYGMDRNKAWIIGLASGLCLMSRYSLAPWYLMYLGFLWYFHSKDMMVRVLTYSLAVVIILLTLGQAWTTLPTFIGLPNHYIDTVISDPSKFLPVIRESLGLIKFISFEQLGSFNKIIVTISVLVPFLCLGIYYRYKKTADIHLFGLCSLKLSLVVFFNFLIIPYTYLFYTSTFLSLFILRVFLRKAELIRA